MAADADRAADEAAAAEAAATAAKNDATTAQNNAATSASEAAASKAAADAAEAAANQARAEADAAEAAAAASAAEAAAAAGRADDAAVSAGSSSAAAAAAEQAAEDAQTAADASAAAAVRALESSRTYQNDASSTAGILIKQGVAPTVIDSPTAIGGKALRKAGSLHGWWEDSTIAEPIDANTLYRMSLRVRITTVQTTTSGGGLYWGAVGLAADKTTYVNSSNANSYSSQQWTNQNVKPRTDGVWVDYIVYYKGISAGNSSGSGTLAAPRMFASNTKYFRPGMILDYNNGNGTWEVSHWSLDAIDPVGHQALLDAAAAQTKANDAHTNAGKAQTTANNAINALSHQGKNLFSPDPPSGTAPLGTVWTQHDETGKSLAVWQQTAGSAPAADGTGGVDGSNWVKRPVRSEMIDNLDVTKLSGGYIDALHINASQLLIGETTLGAKIGEFDETTQTVGGITDPTTGFVVGSKISGTLPEVTIPQLGQEKITNLTTDLSTLSQAAQDAQDAADAAAAQAVSIGLLTDNKLVNPGWEDAFAGWDSAAQHVLDTTVFRSGKQSVRVDGPSAGVRLSPEVVKIPVNPGERWLMGVWYRTTADYNGTASWGKLRWGAQPNSQFITATTFMPGKAEWTWIQLERTIGSGETHLEMILGTDHTVGSIWFDDAEIKNVTALRAAEAAAADAKTQAIAAAATDATNKANTAQSNAETTAANALAPVSSTATTAKSKVDAVTDANGKLLAGQVAGTLADTNIPQLAQSKITNLTTDLSAVSASAAAAMIAGAQVKNPSFEDWPSTVPTSYATFTTAPTKETADKRIGSFAARWNITTASTQAGLGTGSAMSDLPNLQYVTVEVDFKLRSGVLSGAGILVDWNGLTPATLRASIRLADEVPTPSLNKWYRLTKTVKRPTSTGGTWTSMGGYLMANYSSLGTSSVKDIVFDWFNVRPASAQEIEAYETSLKVTAVTDASGKLKADQVAGTLPEVTVPLLTTGKIPSLDASKVTTGTFGTAVKINDGSLNSGISPEKLTGTGTIPETKVPVLTTAKIPTLPQDKITDLPAKIIEFNGTTSRVAGWAASDATFIDGGKIFTDSVKALQIDTNDFWADNANIGAVKAGHIATAALETKHFRVGEVPQNALAVGQDNLLPNPTWAFADIREIYPMSSPFEYNSSASTYQVGTMSALLRGNQASNYATRDIGPKIRVTPGDKFYMRWTGVRYNATIQAYFNLAVYGADGALVNANLYPVLMTSAAPNLAYVVYEGVVTVPAGGFEILPQLKYNGATADPVSSWWAFSDMALRKVLSSTNAVGQSVEVTPQGVKMFHSNGAKAMELMADGIRQWNSSGGQLVDIGSGGENLITGRFQTAPDGQTSVVATNFTSLGARPGIFLTQTGTINGADGGIYSDDEWDTYIRGRNMAGTGQAYLRLGVEPGGARRPYIQSTTIRDITVSKSQGNPVMIMTNGSLGVLTGPPDFTFYGDAYIATCTSGYAGIQGWSGVGNDWSVPLKNTYDGGLVGIRNGSGGDSHVYSNIIYPKTTGSSANVHISSGGYLLRYSSSDKYKVAVEQETGADVAQRFVDDVDFYSWYDKGQSERLAEFLDRKAKGKPLTNSEGEPLDIMVPPGGPQKRIGLMAEQLMAKGLDKYVQVDDDTGEPEGVEYDKIGILWIPAIRERDKTIAAQSQRIDDLEQRLARLEKLVAGGKP
jgi:hypothetical protein